VSVHNKQLLRTVIRYRWCAAIASFHCALAPAGNGPAIVYTGPARKRLPMC